LSEFATTVVPPRARTVSSKRIVTCRGGLASTSPSAGAEETSRACAHAGGASAAAAASVHVHRVKVSRT
jgi:hypothetical protein